MMTNNQANQNDNFSIFNSSQSDEQYASFQGQGKQRSQPTRYSRRLQGYAQVRNPFQNAYKNWDEEQRQDGIKTRIKKGMYSVYESLIGTNSTGSETKYEECQEDHNMLDFGEISEIPHFKEEQEIQLDKELPNRRKFVEEVKVNQKTDKRVERVNRGTQMTKKKLQNQKLQTEQIQTSQLLFDSNRENIMKHEIQIKETENKITKLQNCQNNGFSQLNDELEKLTKNNENLHENQASVSPQMQVCLEQYERKLKKMEEARQKSKIKQAAELEKMKYQNQAQQEQINALVNQFNNQNKQNNHQIEEINKHLDSKMKNTSSTLQEFMKANFEEILKEIEKRKQVETLQSQLFVQAQEQVSIEIEEPKAVCEQTQVWPKSNGLKMNLQSDTTPAKLVFDSIDALQTPATAETRMSSVNNVSTDVKNEVSYATPISVQNQTQSNNLFAQIGGNLTKSPPNNYFATNSASMTTSNYNPNIQIQESTKTASSNPFLTKAQQPLFKIDSSAEKSDEKTNNFSMSQQQNNFPATQPTKFCFAPQQQISSQSTTSSNQDHKTTSNPFNMNMGGATPAVASQSVFNFGTSQKQTNTQDTSSSSLFQTQLPRQIKKPKRQIVANF